MLVLPALLFLGENDMLHLEPLWREPEGEVKTGMIPLSSRDKRAAFNRWRQAGGCAPCEFREAAFYRSSADPAVKSIGAEFERTQVRHTMAATTTWAIPSTPPAHKAMRLRHR